MSINQFSPESLKMIRNELDQAIKPIADKYGIHIKTGKASYTSSNVTFKLEMAVVGSDGVINTKEVEAFKSYASYIGFKPEDLGREFTANGETYRLSGYAPRKAKFPFLATRIRDGRVFGLTIDAVKLGLGYSTAGGNQ